MGIGNGLQVATPFLQLSRIECIDKGDYVTIDNTQAQPQVSRIFRKWGLGGVYVNQVQVGVSDFYANNIKTAKIIGRGALPDTITVSDYVSNADTSKLTAIAFNSGSSFGTFNARLLLSNM